MQHAGGTPESRLPPSRLWRCACPPGESPAGYPRRAWLGAPPRPPNRLRRIGQKTAVIPAAESARAASPRRRNRRPQCPATRRGTALFGRPEYGSSRQWPIAGCASMLGSNVCRYGQDMACRRDAPSGSSGCAPCLVPSHGHAARSFTPSRLHACGAARFACLRGEAPAGYPRRAELGAPEYPEPACAGSDSGTLTRDRRVAPDGTPAEPPTRPQSWPAVLPCATPAGSSHARISHAACAH